MPLNKSDLNNRKDWINHADVWICVCNNNESSSQIAREKKRVKIQEKSCITHALCFQILAFFSSLFKMRYKVFKCLCIAQTIRHRINIFRILPEYYYAHSHWYTFYNVRPAYGQQTKFSLAQSPCKIVFYIFKSINSIINAYNTTSYIRAQTHTQTDRQCGDDDDDDDATWQMGHSPDKSLALLLLTDHWIFH